MRGFLEEFVDPVAAIGDKIVDVAVDVYQKILIDLLPIPEKSHYVFNLRDLSKCVQGVMQANAFVIKEPKTMLR
jgi:dynein heavy chain